MFKMNRLVRLICMFVVLSFTIAEGQEQNKPHVNIIILGQVGHGRAEVTSAITKVLSETSEETKFIAVARVRRTHEAKVGGITMMARRIEYETAHRRYTHVYLPGHDDCIKSMIAGTERMDGAILVVSSKDGFAPETGAQVRLASVTGITTIAVFINVDGEQQVDALQKAISQLLSSHGYPEGNTTIVAGSAAGVLSEPVKQSDRQAVLALLEALDSNIPDAPQSSDQPFRMPIEDVFSITGRGTVVTGRVESGQVKVGDEVQIVGLRPTATTVVTGIEMFRKLLDRAGPGDNIGVLLKGTKRDEVERGQVLAATGSIKPHAKFRAEAYILTKDDGGRQTPFFSDYRPQFYFRTTDVTGTVKLPEGKDKVMPGDLVRLEVTLAQPIALSNRQRFAIREGGRTVGTGVVVEVIE